MLSIKKKTSMLHAVLQSWPGTSFALFQYETTDKNLAPDGQYVPRILFIGEYLS